MFGKISVDNTNDSYLPVVQYTGKVIPVVSVGTQGNGRGEFYNPFGVVVEHKSDYIYVADLSNNRVQVFDREVKYLFEFGSDKMKSPLCIVIYKDRVFVTQYIGGCLLVYDLNGKFIQQVQEVRKVNSINLSVLLSITLMEIFMYVMLLTTEYKYSQMTILTNHNSV